MALKALKTSTLTRLAKAGYVIGRAEARTRPVMTHFDPELRRQVARSLESYDFSRSIYWTKPSMVMDYLDVARVNTYHQVVQAAIEAGIDLTGKSAIDIGAATGYLLKILDQKFDDVRLFGTDYYEENTRLSKALVPESTMFHASIDDLKTQPGRYDAVFCTEVLEHILDTETQIPSMLGLLNPGGSLVVTVPNGTYDTTPPFTSSDGTSFVGHVNFWTAQSWGYYLDRIARTLDYDVEIRTGMLDNNFAGDILFASLRKV